MHVLYLVWLLRTLITIYIFIFIVLPRMLDLVKSSYDWKNGLNMSVYNNFRFKVYWVISILHLTANFYNLISRKSKRYTCLGNPLLSIISQKMFQPLLLSSNKYKRINVLHNNSYLKTLPFICHVMFFALNKLIIICSNFILKNQDLFFYNASP